MTSGCVCTFSFYFIYKYKHFYHFLFVFYCPVCNVDLNKTTAQLHLYFWFLFQHNKFCLKLLVLFSRHNWHEIHPYSVTYCMFTFHPSIHFPPLIQVWVTTATFFPVMSSSSSEGFWDIRDKGYVILLACSGSATRASSQFVVSRKQPDQMPRPPLLVPLTAKVQPCVTKQDTLPSPQTCLGKTLLPEASDGLPELKSTTSNSQWTHQAHPTHEFLLPRPQRLETFWSANISQQIQEFIGLTKPKRPLPSPCQLPSPQLAQMTFWPQHWVAASAMEALNFPFGLWVSGASYTYKSLCA